MSAPLEIPLDQLSAEALQGLMEEFITREGTDYGEQQWTLAQKVEQVRRQLQRREAKVVFDAITETCTIVPAR